MRFHVSVRCLASALFILLRIAWMAAATYAASVAIAGISGIDQYVIIISLGAVAIAYTRLGGLRAVMWTDVLQFFVFAGTSWRDCRHSALIRSPYSVTSLRKMLARLSRGSASTCLEWPSCCPDC